MKIRRLFYERAALTCGFIALLLLPAHADTIDYNVNLNTSSLTSGTNYRLDFFFTNGTAGQAGNSDLRINNFNFGTGGTGTPASSGELQTTDVEAGPTPNVNGRITQRGSTLSFGLNFDYDLQPQAPDSLGFAIFNLATNAYITAPNAQNGAPPSNGSGNIFLFTVDLSQTPVVKTFDNNTLNFDPTVTAVPEPGTLILMLCGLSGLAAQRRKKKPQLA